MSLCLFIDSCFIPQCLFPFHSRRFLFLFVSLSLSPSWFHSQCLPLFMSVFNFLRSPF